MTAGELFRACYRRLAGWVWRLLCLLAIDGPEGHPGRLQ
jgi:hypothetical protein